MVTVLLGTTLLGVSVPGQADASPVLVKNVFGVTVARDLALRTVKVTSVATLTTAIAQAKPGDRIELADGSYKLSKTISVSKSGTTSAPIVIVAANTGLAEISGSGGFKLTASHLTIEGLKFINSLSLDVPATASHVRLVRNTFQLASKVKNWVTIAGDDCEVDHNLFRSKSTVGVFLQITGPGENDMAKRTWVHHNQFLNHSFSGSNGGESIRLGLSMRQHGKAAAIIEDNLLEGANGDPEAISVKSSDNIIRRNTIRNSTGTITLRHGNRNTVDSNLLIGGGTGIRVFGNDHVVVNNVVQESSREILIAIGGGDIRDDTKNTNVHEAADRALIAFNTVIGKGKSAGAGIVLGESDDKYAPDSITFANNLVLNVKKAVQVTKGTKITWQGNATYGTADKTLITGLRGIDPQLVKVDGLYRLSALSPVIGAGVGMFAPAALDLDGQPRNAHSVTIGADEYVATGGDRVPIVASMVGPSAG